MNINIGDLINQTGFTHYTPNLQVRFGVPKGRVSVMLMLGDADKKAPETFDAKAALNGLGWVEETRLTEAEHRNSELAGLLEHAYGCIENSKEWRWLIDRIDAALKPTNSGSSL